MLENYSTEYRRYFDLTRLSEFMTSNLHSTEYKLNYLSFLKKANKNLMDLAEYVSETDLSLDKKFNNHVWYDEILEAAIEKLKSNLN